jgi:hypothetical protein
MESSWFVKPVTRRIPLSDAQWIVVKERLCNGEFRAHLTRSSYIGADGIRRLDSLLEGLSVVVAYLLDWSLPDAVIRGVPEDELVAALDNLDPRRFTEIKQAIERHLSEREAEREKEKNEMDGGKKSSAISPLLSAAAGELTGSVS